MIETYNTAIVTSGLEDPERLALRKEKAIASSMDAIASKIETGKQYTLIVGEWQERPMSWDCKELSLEIQIFSVRPYATPQPLNVLKGIAQAQNNGGRD